MEPVKTETEAPVLNLCLEDYQDINDKLHKWVIRKGLTIDQNAT